MTRNSEGIDVKDADGKSVTYNKDGRKKFEMKSQEVTIGRRG